MLLFYLARIEEFDVRWINSMRDDFSQKTKQTLACRVGMRCSNPKCRKPTSGPVSNPTESLNIGVAAHITAAAVGGSRYNEGLSSEARKSIENGIWLCQNCAKLADNDPALYTVESLRRWKRVSEQITHQHIETNMPAKKTTSSVEELITIIEIRAAVVVDHMDELQAKAVAAYLSENFSSKHNALKEGELALDDLGIKSTLRQHNEVMQFLSKDKPSRWFVYESEADLASELKSLREKFLNLHVLHKEELFKGNYVAAHELVGQIHSIIEVYNLATDPPYPRFDFGIRYYIEGPTQKELAKQLLKKHEQYPGRLPMTLLPKLPRESKSYWIVDGDDEGNINKALNWQPTSMDVLFELYKFLRDRKDI